MASVLLHTVHYPLETGFLTELGTLLSIKSLQSCCLHVLLTTIDSGLSLWLSSAKPGLCMSAAILKPGFHAYTAITFPPEPSPQHFHFTLSRQGLLLS